MPNSLNTQCCVICDNDITQDNKSREHVIPECIGGRLTVDKFICRSCNNTSGSTWDAELSSQLLPLMLIFGVRRQRGSTPGLRVTSSEGEQLVINPGGGISLRSPPVSKIAGPDGVTYDIKARTKDEARKILKRLKRKYPNIDIETKLSGAQESYSYAQGQVCHNLSIGGEVSGRSIVKSILAFACHAGIPMKGCKEALDYLKNPAATPCFGYFQENDLVINRPQDVPLNCVSVDANPSTGLIIGYIEYFGIYRIVACIGREYSGNRVAACYAFDPRNGVKHDVSVRLEFNESDINDIYNYKMIPDGSMQHTISPLLSAALKRQFDEEVTRVSRDAAEYAFANCGAKPGECLTATQIQELNRLVLERIAPFIQHHLVRNRTS